MNKKFTKRFSCPDCKNALRLVVLKSEGDEIIDGFFICATNCFFPLISGVPRFLNPALLVQVVSSAPLTCFVNDYRASVPVEWSDQIRKTAAPSASAVTAQFYRFQWKHYKTNFDNDDRSEWDRLIGGKVRPADYRDKTIIDVGGGQGRFLVPFLAAGAREIVCMDLSESIESAYVKFKSDDRVVCVQADLYNPPFLPFFDLVMSIGVLQHLPRPADGFKSLVNLAKADAAVLIWCYGRSSLEHQIVFLRRLARCFPISWQWMIASFLGLVRYMISLLPRGVAMDEYRGYGFRYYWTNSFDHLATPVINFFRREEIESWLQASAVTRYDLIERFPGKSNSSWLIFAQKAKN